VVSQQSVRQRAMNYFVLWELLGHKPGPTDEAWARLKNLVDVDQPLRAETVMGLARFDLTPAQFELAVNRVVKSLASLREDDRIVARGKPDYPALLAETRDAPEFLFLRGRAELLEAPCLAVVGTRNPTPEGERRARKLGCLLADRGIVVASGLARGIDSAAHIGCLEHGGDTIAVLGTPLTRTYPKENADLQEAISSLGLLVSQFYPGTRTNRFHFPMRNAVMSGLCLGTIVVEASETSGALIQARKCLEQGRRLFIPRSAVSNPALKWPRAYLAKGAIEFSTIEDITNRLDRWLEAEPVGGLRSVAHRCSLSLSISRR